MRNAAADIAASGRWDSVNARIERFATAPPPAKGWHVQILGNLTSHVFDEYLALKRAYETRPDDDSSLLAWRARNLLELSVWSIYCTKSEEHARRFYEDAGRDVLGVFKAFSTWGSQTGQDADWIDPIEKWKSDLLNRAATEGIESLDGPYKAVSEAARECGLGNHFPVSYKLLSKFAHPTAMRIAANPDKQKNAIQRDHFFSDGCLFFVGAFDALERELIRLVTEQQ